MATSNNPETAAVPNFGNVSSVDAAVEDSPAHKQEEHEKQYEDEEEIQHEDEEAEKAGLGLHTTLTHHDDDYITNLAREFSRHQSMNRTRSHRSNKTDDLTRTTSQAEYGSDDPRLDPASKSFDLPTYLKMIMRMLTQQDIDTKEAGIVMKNLNVFGSGKALNFQETVTSFVTWPASLGGLFKKQPHKQILYENNALLKSGELLIVLGRPGAGCSTFLKSICGEQHGLIVNDDATIHYSGVEQKQMLKEFKGEIVYNQEVDKHFPHLTVGETLEHAAALRLPAQQPFPQPRKEVVKHITQVIMAIFGLSHTYNTKVGNDFVRGVSGGERKRVSIAEMAIAGTPISAWDNSTRGLDSQSAFNFVKCLRFTADIAHATHAVAIYQASQAIYDEFDRAVVLYEGRQIYYGSASRAKAYFEEMGWECPARQTTGDFLTSVTNPVERKAKSGYENKVPRTPDEFATYWKKHPQYNELIKETEEYEKEYPTGNTEQLEKLRSIKKGAQGKGLVRHKSPYVATIPQQISLNTKRAWQRIWNDKPATASQIVINIIFALIIGSVFYDTPNATVGFQSKGAVLFFAVLLNALTAISEISGLYAQRPIVEKHKSYAFYHPWTEAAAGVVLDIPVKFATAVVFNVILYFLAGLRREPGPFFLYFLINYIAVFVMSSVFRTMAALTKTVSQAMALSGVLVLAIVVYTGFTLPVPYMHPWFGWIRWINPVFYAFEVLIANEFHNQNFICSAIIPAYTPTVGNSWICSATGAVAGQDYVNGDVYIQTAYEYSYSHVWRNFGILLGFLFAFLAMYMIAVEFNSSTSSTAEVLVFKKGQAPAHLKNIDKRSDSESGSEGSTVGKAESNEDQEIDAIPPQKDIFTWKDVVFDVKLKNGDQRRLLDHVSGWVKPGTLTALMGSSGAGKTTLLDALAQRLSTGVITGDMLVNGKPLGPDFQRQTGYVQQQDLHLDTSTVREALRFSAILRQPRTESKQAKYDYVEQVIQMLGMQDFAEAVVGVPGQGLNVEQRKLLTIGVELAAKPKLLLFLDEPTSGLDSQSSWAICSFLRKLADHGQAVLCTIHQPSAILFEQFDRLLFLQKGGQTVYFGDVGNNSRTLLDYFERNGGRHCAQDENPAEYMLEMVNNGQLNWHDIWKESTEFEKVNAGIEELNRENDSHELEDKNVSHTEFAMPLTTQIYEVTYRVFQQYWRMPSYVAAKYLLAGASGLFIGFSFFQADTSLQGMQIVLYSLFMVASIFSTIVQQIQPMFVNQRDLYEVRERPSKAYSWVAFVFAQIVVEIPYQIIMGLVTYACFYYAVVGIQSSERQGLVLLYCVALFVYASTFAHMTIAAMPDAQTAGAIVTLLFAMSLVFCGVMQSPTALPGFWIFMYRVSPFTYWVGGMADAMLAHREIICSAVEVSRFDPPSGLSCGQYLAPYLQLAPGTLQNPNAMSNCEYCQLSNADQFLSGVQIYWSDRWRDFGLLWVYIFFNIFATIAIYWFFRVRPVSAKAKKGKGKKGAK